MAFDQAGGAVGDDEQRRAEAAAIRSRPSACQSLYDQQQPRVGVLLSDELGSGGPQLDVHKSSTDESDDRVPPDAYASP
jgi:hypothetical protein